MVRPEYSRHTMPAAMLVGHVRKRPPLSQPSGTLPKPRPARTRVLGGGFDFGEGVGSGCGRGCWSGWGRFYESLHHDPGGMVGMPPARVNVDVSSRQEKRKKEPPLRLRMLPASLGANPARL